VSHPGCSLFTPLVCSQCSGSFKGWLLPPNPVWSKLAMDYVTVDVVMCWPRCCAISTHNYMIGRSIGTGDRDVQAAWHPRAVRKLYLFCGK